MYLRYCVNVSLNAVAVSHIRHYEDANEFTTCLDKCAPSERASDPGGWSFLSLCPPIFPATSRPCSHHLWKDLSVSWTTTPSVRGHRLCDRPLKIRPDLKWKISQPHQNYLWLFSLWECVQSRNNVEALMLKQTRTRGVPDSRPTEGRQKNLQKNQLYSTIALQSSTNYCRSQFKRKLQKLF